MQPYRYDPDNVPVFTSNQVDDYGFPEHWGFECYRIVENRESTAFVLDYKAEQSYIKRPIHRYNRILRFENTLQQLMAVKGKVPDHVIAIVKHFLIGTDNLWDQIRRILKHYKWRIYYNRIPLIIKKCTNTKVTSTSQSDETYRAIVQDFRNMCYLFDKNKHTINRKYFPNLRFIALKLLQAHGVQLNYPIPLTRTSRKRKDLETIWQLFIN